MAKINFGTIVSDARGKINGVVMSKNKSGAYARTKVTPSNPRTTAQQAVRSNFAQLAQAWSSTLTTGERAAWTSYAETYPRRNIFGNALTLNGLNMYISLGMVMLQMGQTPISSPPSISGVSPAIWAPTWDILSTTEVKITESSPSSALDGWNYVFATKSLPPGRAATPSDYRFVFAAADPGMAGVIDISTAYIAIFGAPISGSKVYGLIATADSNTGLISVAQPLSGVVA